MPNWCSTNITIRHKDEAKIQDLENLILEWTSKNYKENGFGTKWLGNIVLGSGIGQIKKIRCRGWVSGFSAHGDTLDIHTETAWSPMLEMWIKVIDKFIPGAELTYAAVENNCGLYCTNKPNYRDRYYYESDTEMGSVGDDCITKELLVPSLQLDLQTDEEDFTKLLKMCSEYNDKSDGYICVHHWEWVKPELLP